MCRLVTNELTARAHSLTLSQLRAPMQRLLKAVLCLSWRPYRYPCHNRRNCRRLERERESMRERKPRETRKVTSLHSSEEFRRDQRSLMPRVASRMTSIFHWRSESACPPLNPQPFTHGRSVAFRVSICRLHSTDCVSDSRFSVTRDAACRSHRGSSINNRGGSGTDAGSRNGSR